MKQSFLYSLIFFFLSNTPSLLCMEKPIERPQLPSAAQQDDAQIIKTLAQEACNEGVVRDIFSLALGQDHRLVRGM